MKVIRIPYELESKGLTAPQRPARRYSAAICCSAAAQIAVPASYQEEAYDWLAERVLKTAQPNTRHFVGIGGVPGSGKSTAAAEVARRINQRRGCGDTDSAAVALAVPMDGYHYYRRELDAMPDPECLHGRRGAHWTFNAQAFVAAMRRVRTEDAVSLPSFAHGIGDPVEDDIRVEARHSIVLVEGNYLLIDVEPWDQLAALFDDTWFIDCGIDTAMERIYERQVGDGRPPEVVRGRIANNDRPNAELVVLHKQRANVLVPSVPFKFRV